MELLKIEGIKTAVEQAVQNTTDAILDKLKENMLSFILYVLKCLGTFLIETSGVTCPIICLLAVCFYVAGNRKAGKWVSGSIVSYFICQALRMVLK
jgi:hypothetical protein